MGPIHYIDEGTGPPILFVHGNPTWSFLYRGVVIRLRDRFRCVALDLPGFGLSSRPPDFGHTPAEHASVVRGLVRYLALDELTFVGHDWGGPLALRTALDEPDRVRALVMANTWYGPADAIHLKAFSRLASTDFGRRLILRRDLLVDRLLPLGMNHTPAPEVLDQYRGPLSTPEDRAGAAELPRQLTRARPWLTALADEVPGTLGDRPLLLTWGMDDYAFTPSFMDRFRRDFSRVRAVHLEARHFVPEDDPGGVAGAVRQFLESIRG